MAASAQRLVPPDVVRPRRFALPAGGRAELLALLGLYAGYSAVRLMMPGGTALARAHGQQLLDLERLLHLDVEAAANAWLAAHLTIALLASYWYATVHFTVTPVVLLLLRRRAPQAVYRGMRNALIVATLLALVGYGAYPTMPPRLLGGYADTLALTADHGWWGAQPSGSRGMSGLTNQYAAMPSMHVGWAVWCAIAGTLLLGGSRWRWLVWLYPAVTLTVVMATANHFLVDGLAGAALVLAACVRLRACPGSSSSTTRPRRRWTTCWRPC